MIEKSILKNQITYSHIKFQSHHRENHANIHVKLSVTKKTSYKSYNPALIKENVAKKYRLRGNKYH